MISQNNGEVRDQHCDNVLYTTGKNTTTFVKKKKKNLCRQVECGCPNVSDLPRSVRPSSECNNGYAERVKKIIEKD